MSEENIELGRRFNAAYNARDLDAMRELLTPDVEWKTIGARLVEGVGYRGHEGTHRYFQDLAEAWEYLIIELQEVRDLDGTVVGLGRINARGRGSGVVLDSEYGGVLSTRAGRIHEVVAYFDQRRALEAAGLEE